jgi:hypothetical protein
MVDFFLFFFPSNGGYYLLVLFGLWSFCFSLDRSSGVGSSLSPSRAMVLLFCFDFFIFFSLGRKSLGSGIGVSPVIAGGAFFFLHLLLKPDLCLSAGASTARSSLWCLPDSSGLPPQATALLDSSAWRVASTR